jgi:hypothetical protein
VSLWCNLFLAVAVWVLRVSNSVNIAGEGKDLAIQVFEKSINIRTLTRYLSILFNPLKIWKQMCNISPYFSCRVQCYFLLLCTIISFPWMRQLYQKLAAPLRFLILRRSPTQFLIPITGRVAPSFPARVVSVVLTPCCRQASVRTEAVDGVDRDICRLKYILFFLACLTPNMPFWFTLYSVH